MSTTLREAGLIDSRFNWIFFTRGASREPEMAGILGRRRRLVLDAHA